MSDPVDRLHIPQSRDAPRVLIVSARAGTGHMKAAEALENAFRRRYPDVVVKRIDLLDYCAWPARQLYGGAYGWVAKTFPFFYGYLYSASKSGQSAHGLRMWFDRLNAASFFRLLAAFRPDAVISTHFIPANLAAEYQERRQHDLRVFVTLTDYEVHPFWLVRHGHVEGYSVAHPLMKHELVRLGVPGDSILDTGIPIDPAFMEEKDRGELRRRYGLKETSPVILLMAGWNFRVSAVERMIDHLGMVDGAFQLVVLAGRNKELYKRVEAKQSRERRIALIFEFIDFVETLMRLSDILISKPGGITTAESLAAGLPMIMVDPIPGQEEANSDYILENGAGLKARSLEDLGFKINHLAADPARLEHIRENIRRIARPDAAFSIVDAVARSLSLTP